MFQLKNIIPYVFLFGLESSYYINTTLRDRIPFYLQKFCPGSGVCLNDIIDPEDNVPSCCGACSCSAGCEREGNCCFQSQDNNTIDYEHPTRYYSECLYPLPNQNKAFYNKVYHSYYMISSTAEEAIVNERTNNTITCGEVRIAPWGSLYPVYSKTTGKIYKNSVCADAYNVTDGELWSFYFKCSVFNIDLVSRLQEGFFPDGCLLRFYYKGGMHVVKSEMCYNIENYKASCLHDHNSHELPESLSLSKEEIVAACESGLLTPYENIFANIFCFICTRFIYPRQRDREYCSKDFEINQILTGRGGNNVFTLIFEGKDYKESLSEDAIQMDYNENDRIACPEESDMRTGVGCRTISCPAGQILSRGKGCIYAGNKWYTNIIHVIMNLSSKRTVDISSLYHSIQNLESPWPRSWIIEEVSYVITDIPRQTKSIMVVQYFQFKSPYNPASFFSSVNYYSSKPWLLKSNNVTIRLQAKISKFIVDRSKWSSTKTVYVQYNIRKKIHAVVSKLYFCDRVTLLPAEYSINRHRRGEKIFIKITNKTLFDGEYTIAENERGPVPTICLEDSGLYRVSSNNSIRKIHPGMIIQCLPIIFRLLNVFMFR